MLRTFMTKKGTLFFIRALQKLKSKSTLILDIRFLKIPAEMRKRQRAEAIWRRGRYISFLSIERNKKNSPKRTTFDVMPAIKLYWIFL